MPLVRGRGTVLGTHTPRSTWCWPWTRPRVTASTTPTPPPPSPSSPVPVSEITGSGPVVRCGAWCQRGW